jgi:hypothetical protein
MVFAGAIFLVVIGWSSRYGFPETWIEISPVTRMNLGEPQQLSVALKYRPPFLVASQARPIAGTIQLISFGERVEVAPTTLVTTGQSPTATFTVTGKKIGVEELIFAGSDSPKEASSWRTMSTKAVVVAKASP